MFNWNSSILKILPGVCTFWRSLLKDLRNCVILLGRKEWSLYNYKYTDNRVKITGWRSPRGCHLTSSLLSFIPVSKISILAGHPYFFVCHHLFLFSKPSGSREAYILVITSRASWSSDREFHTINGKIRRRILHEISSFKYRLLKRIWTN